MDGGIPTLGERRRDTHLRREEAGYTHHGREATHHPGICPPYTPWVYHHPVYTPTMLGTGTQRGSEHCSGLRKVNNYGNIRQFLTFVLKV